MVHVEMGTASKTVHVKNGTSWEMAYAEIVAIVASWERAQVAEEQVVNGTSRECASSDMHKWGRHAQVEVVGMATCGCIGPEIRQIPYRKCYLAQLKWGHRGYSTGYHLSTVRKMAEYSPKRLTSQLSNIIELSSLSTSWRIYGQYLK